MSISKLDAHTGYLLRVVSNAVSQDFSRKITRAGVTVAEWVVLRSLYDIDALSPSALAAKMGMTKGAISKLTDRLLDKGLVVRHADHCDRRTYTLSLSPAGLRKMPILAALADKNEAEYFALLEHEDHEALNRILKTLIKQRGLWKTAV